MAQLDKLKLTMYTWDSTKEPHGFYIWLENFGCLVRATEHGGALEDMLDSKLRRVKVSRHNVPSYLLDDPDFAVPATTITREGEAGIFANSPTQSSGGGSTTSVHFSLGTHHVAYQDLPAGSKTLDGLLYNILRVNVRGEKNALLSAVTFPSYVQGVCILYKHMSLSRMERIMAAFKTMDNLTFARDVHQFQTSFLAASRELDHCGATILHYTMCRLMRSFDGKSKTIQFKIAEDFNRMDELGEHTNMFDIVQRYCSELAAVGDSKPSLTSGSHQGNSVMMVNDDVICDHCKEEGHMADACPKLDRINQTRAKKDIQRGKRVKSCTKCNRVGHTASECFSNTDNAPRGGAKPAADKAPEITAPTDAKAFTDTSSVDPAAIEQIMMALRAAPKTTHPVHSVTSAKPH